MNREPIKDFYGRLVGSIETDTQGNQKAYDFYGKYLGKYDKRLNKTFDFYGRIISSGNILQSLIWNSKKEK